MKRTCKGEDDTLVTPSGERCACGRTFDDVECSVIWPHTTLMTREEKAEIFKILGIEL